MKFLARLQLMCLQLLFPRTSAWSKKVIPHQQCQDRASNLLTNSLRTIVKKGNIDIFGPFLITRSLWMFKYGIWRSRKGGLVLIGCITLVVPLQQYLQACMWVTSYCQQISWLDAEWLAQVPVDDYTRDSANVCLSEASGILTQPGQFSFHLQRREKC